MGTLGNTGLKVSRLGAGLAEIGEELTMADVERAGRVLNTALDGGICFLDTAAGYLISEELVGRTIAHRRDEYVLATKCGAVGNKGTVKLWNAQAITDNIDRSLRRLRTDRLDLVQLHSCDVEVLKQGEATEALLAAKQAGKTRFVGYSGDNEAALWAVESGLFDTLQTSFSVVDQHARTRLFGPARARGMGIIVKRPIANGAWGASHSPTADLNYEPMRTYGDEYFRRAQVMAQMGGIPGAPDDRFLVALGFVMAHPEIDTAIVGTYNPAHMAANIEMVEGRLPIPGEVVEELHRRFDEAGEEWLQRS
jgi:aryl-alcohol dehydrogenase-like predicted oxidoreductase